MLLQFGFKILPYTWFVFNCHAFALAPHSQIQGPKFADIQVSIQSHDHNVDAHSISRDAFNVILSMALVVAAAPTYPADAQPKEFESVGTQAPLPKGEETPFRTLENGVKVKDFRIPQSNDVPVVKEGSRVSVQLTGRLLNLNGVIFYSTKNNNPDGFGPEPLTITLGKGQALPGLEQGMLGMKKGGIRRIIVPAKLAYSEFPDLEPKPLSAVDQRALDSVVKNPRRDATILFDVQVERVK